ncbi:MAG: NADH-quinone oxidoreductase subunit J [Alphaproteobacteria bacterium]|jgi:NADH-quinone oxidoreductase subunit J
MTEFLFYAFAALAIFSCLMVILSSNAINSILFLVFSYLNVSALFVSIGADFAAMMLAVVYVGAVAVLFLFVVMMLDIEYGKLKTVLHNHTMLIFMLIGIFALEILFGFYARSAFSEIYSNTPLFYEGNSIKEVGLVLYTDYVLYFQLSGVVLLLAMVGAISLTLRQREGVKRQNPTEQIFRDSKAAVTNIDIKPDAVLEE